MYPSSINTDKFYRQIIDAQMATSSRAAALADAQLLASTSLPPSHWPHANNPNDYDDDDDGTVRRRPRLQEDVLLATLQFFNREKLDECREIDWRMAEQVKRATPFYHRQQFKSQKDGEEGNPEEDSLLRQRHSIEGMRIQVVS